MTEKNMIYFFLAEVDLDKMALNNIYLQISDYRLIKSTMKIGYRHCFIDYIK